MAGTAFFGELQRARHSAADDLAWTIRSGGVWDLYRWSDETVLQGAAIQEVVANPYTSLGFNPRGIVWEEQLALSRRLRGLHWHAGLFHRCRHEIDNSDPPEQRTPQPGYVPAKRVVVLSGLQIGVTTNEIPAGSLRLRMSARAETYLAREDTRIPATAGRPIWTEASAAFSGVVRAEQPLGTHAVYARAWGALIPFNEPSGTALRHNERIEAGLRLNGRGAAMEIFAAGERTFDDFATLAPRESRFISVGIRLAGRDLY